MNDQQDVPPGFERVPEGLGFSDTLQPYYRRIDESGVSFGMHVRDQHINLMGMCHGGALMALADIAAATSINHRLATPQLLPTINLSFDFQSPGRRDRWLHTQVDHMQLKRRFGFCSGRILDGESSLVRFSGVFYILDRPPDDAEAAALALRLLSGRYEPPP